MVAVSVNGPNAETLVSPFLVIANALVELSMRRLDWQVSREVPDMAVRGEGGGVKLEV